MKSTCGAGRDVEAIEIFAAPFVEEIVKLDDVRPVGGNEIIEHQIAMLPLFGPRDFMPRGVEQDDRGVHLRVEPVGPAVDEDPLVLLGGKAEEVGPLARDLAADARFERHLFGRGDGRPRLTAIDFVQIADDEGPRIRDAIFSDRPNFIDAGRNRGGNRRRKLLGERHAAACPGSGRTQLGNGRDSRM